MQTVNTDHAVHVLPLLTHGRTEFRPWTCGKRIGGVSIIRRLDGNDRLVVAELVIFVRSEIEVFFTEFIFGYVAPTIVVCGLGCMLRLHGALDKNVSITNAR